MPGIACKCGSVIMMGDIPNPNEWLFIADTDFDHFEGMVDVESLYKQMKSFVVCQNCGRLYLYLNGFNEAPTVYIKEKEKTP